MKRTLFIVLSLPIFMCYQNCSHNISFANQADTTSSKLASNPQTPAPVVGNDPDPNPAPAPAPDNGNHSTPPQKPPCAGGDKGDDDSGDDHNYVAACDQYLHNLKNLETLNSGDALLNLRGNHSFKANKISRVKDSQGKLQLVGSTADASIGSIDNSVGNIVICDMDVTKIENFAQGNIVIVRGNVGSIDGFKGSLKLIGGTVTGDVKNSFGNIKFH